MALSGLTGYVVANGITLSASKWEASLDQVVVDRSNFMTQGEPLTAPGQRTGDISIEGPYEGAIGFDRGELVTLQLGFTSIYLITVAARVSNLTLSDDKDTGPMFKITAKQHGAAVVSLL